MKKFIIFSLILVIYFSTKNFVNYPKLLDLITLISVAGFILYLFCVPLLFSIISFVMLLCGKWKTWSKFVNEHAFINKKIDLFSSHKRNPATGLPMRKNSLLDIGGNVRGTRRY